MTLWLGHEHVIHHPRLLDTYAFDIVICTEFPSPHPQQKFLSLQPPCALHCSCRHWPFLCFSGAERRKRFWSALRGLVLSN